AAICVLLAPTWVGAQDEADLFLLDFHADGYLLAESVPAYASGDTFLIDFALFLEAVEFPIEQKDQLWSGWFYAEDRQFVWRMDLGVVQLAGGHSERLEYDEWMDTYDGTYVSVQALERWFNLELNVDPRLQIMTVDSSEPLPFQLWRDRMLAKYRYRPGGHSDADVIVPDQYHWATMPLVDLSSQLLTQSQGDGSSNSASASLAMGMDLLKHSVVYTGGFSQGSGQRNSINRLTVERASATPDTPLFAGVHRYILGDIYQASPNLVNDSNTGRGFSIDRYPAGRSGNLSQATIAGDAPPGWQVELYRNGALLEFATVGSDGRYFFPDQDIPFGENVFVAKLYGPQGQTREDRQTFWGGGTDLARDDYDFSISHIDFDHYLLDGVPDNVDALTASYATDFRYTRALTEDLQLGTAYTRTGRGSRERDGTFTDSDYLSLFGSMKLGPGVLVGEAVHQFDAGAAWSLEYLTGYKGQKISIAHRAFDNYVSPATIRREDLDALNEISVFGSFGNDKQNAYTFRLRHRSRAEGPSDLRLFNQLSLSLGRLNLTNDLDHLVTSGPDTTTGRLRLASRVKGVSVRGQLDYRLTSSQPLTQISVSTNWNMSGRLNNNLTLSKQLTNDKLMFLTNQLSIRIRDYDLTLSVSSDFEDTWSVGAGFNIAFGYDGRRQEFITDNGGLANTGRATMNLFIDENNDGIRDPNELPVTWASYRDQETLKMSPGVLPLTALPSARPVLFDMRFMTLDDPFLVPRAKAYELRTHAGSDVSIDVAVIMTGDIEGHIMAGSADGRAVRGIIVSLHDSEGREVARTRSEFDGFYSFTGVAGGDYEVRVTTNGGQSELVQPFSLDPQDGYIVLERIYIFE
ncbi:MAG: carboxypeptidase regulatory-like domain-containing protein, partial [Proteobacteria bacterium]|nr:carboxypeptidase regulatory-like domain-containing protein [Pseudomonadota bacterium]